MTEEFGLFKKHLIENERKARNLNNFHLRTTRWKFSTTLSQGISFGFLKWKKPMIAGIGISFIIDYLYRFEISEH